MYHVEKPMMCMNLSFINMVFRQVDVGWVALRDWTRWGKWRSSTSTSWPWYMLTTSSWKNRETVRNKCKRTQKNTWHQEIQISSSVWDSVRDSILSVQTLRLCECVCFLCVCVRSGPSGTCPVGAEQHDSPGASAAGAQRAAGEKRGDAAATRSTSRCIKHPVLK